MNYFEGIILSFLDMCMIIIIMRFFISDRTTKNGMIAILYALTGALIMGTVGYYIDFPPIGLFINIIIVFFIIWVMTKKQVKDLVILFVFISTILYSIQFASTIFFKLTLNNFEYSFFYGFISQSTALTITFLTTRIIPIEGIYQYISEKNKWFAIITVNIYAIYYVLILLWYTQLHSFYNSILGILILIALILVVNAMILNNALQNEVAFKTNKVYEKYLKVIEDVIEEVRLKQHDHHNHIQTLEAILNNGDDNEAFLNYRNQLTNNDILDDLLKLNNRILIAFLYSKYCQALELGITINYTITNYYFNTRYMDHELVDIFGIMIDNAIEASKKENSDTLEIEIAYEKGMNIIRSKNRAKVFTSDEINKLFDYGYSTNRETGRGIGLYKLSKLLKKEKGIISVYYDTNLQEIEFTAQLY